MKILIFVLKVNEHDEYEECLHVYLAKDLADKANFIERVREHYRDRVRIRTESFTQKDLIEKLGVEL